ncbi:Hypothetical protein, putative [Bodo saltans]|uniref:Uncharacterized protein n=1 Tax=Bodo saltans TaxID=75058 RepID=A0A0S4JHE1_BODSA|nr:Hypothetical protein, putative [Bodo saltans]|eukprot:CUG89553.1 Hypothetical protein, putative [Bodo saltans]
MAAPSTHPHPPSKELQTNTSLHLLLSLVPSQSSLRACVFPLSRVYVSFFLFVLLPATRPPQTQPPYASSQAGWRSTLMNCVTLFVRSVYGAALVQSSPVLHALYFSSHSHCYLFSTLFFLFFCFCERSRNREFDVRCVLSPDGVSSEIASKDHPHFHFFSPFLTLQKRDVTPFSNQSHSKLQPPSHFFFFPSPHSLFTPYLPPKLRFLILLSRVC